MALSVSTQVNPIATRLIEQTSANSTSNNNVCGASCTIYTVDVDNTANVAASYVKLYDNAAPVVGTTNPDIVVVVPAGDRRQYVIPEGVDFSTALSFCCVTVGGTQGTISPASAVIVRILASV
jgi:hypothetical protein